MACRLARKALAVCQQAVRRVGGGLDWQTARVTSSPWSTSSSSSLSLSLSVSIALFTLDFLCLQRESERCTYSAEARGGTRQRRLAASQRNRNTHTHTQLSLYARKLCWRWGTAVLHSVVCSGLKLFFAEKVRAAGDATKRRHPCFLNYYTLKYKAGRIYRKYD